MTALTRRLLQHARDLEGDIRTFDRADADRIRKDLIRAAHLLDAPGLPEPRRREFSAWLREAESASGKAYRADQIRWLRERCFAAGMSPAKAVDAWEREMGL